MKYLVLLVCLSIVGVLGKGVYFLALAPGVPSEQVRFEIHKGEGFSKVARRLVDEGLITDQFLFKVLGRLTGAHQSIKVGDYMLDYGMNPLEVLTVIESGKSVVFPITFPEGYNMYEIAQLVERAGIAPQAEFLEACRDKNLIRDLLGQNLSSLEGYLFPETYSVTKYVTPKELITMMVEKFKEVYAELASTRPEGFTRHQWVTLASLIEKETGYKAERLHISAVFHNRLKKAMRLQTDPTVIYGLWDQTQQPVTNIKKRHLKEKNKYNTYTFRGLPYGPISNPGREAFIAAFQPSDTDYLYFVSKNDGTSHFSETLREHNNAVNRYQKSSNYRKGRSWRDLQQ